MLTLGNRQLQMLSPPGVSAADGHLGLSRGVKNAFAAMKRTAIRSYRVAFMHSGVRGMSTPFGVRSPASGLSLRVFNNTYAPLRH